MNRIAMISVLAASAMIATAASAVPPTAPTRSTSTGAQVGLPNIAQGPAVGGIRDGINAKFTGQKSGAIPAAGEPALSCIRLNHSIVSPRDPQSGLPTGQRMHKPLVCTVRSVSKGLIRLFSVLAANENLTSATFTLGGKDASVLKLTNAAIASIDTHTDDTGAYFDVAFVYSKIEWSKDNVIFNDNWEGRI